LFQAFCDQDDPGGDGGNSGDEKGNDNQGNLLKHAVLSWEKKEPAGF